MCIELKPCPFCGAIAEVFTQPPCSRAVVICTSSQCNARIYAATKKAAITAWNKRAEVKND